VFIFDRRTLLRVVVCDVVFVVCFVCVTCSLWQENLTSCGRLWWCACRVCCVFDVFLFDRRILLRVVVCGVIRVVCFVCVTCFSLTGEPYFVWSFVVLFVSCVLCVWRVSLWTGEPYFVWSFVVLFVSCVLCVWPVSLWTGEHAQGAPLASQALLHPMDLRSSGCQRVLGAQVWLFQRARPLLRDRRAGAGANLFPKEHCEGGKYGAGIYIIYIFIYIFIYLYTRAGPAVRLASRRWSESLSKRALWRGQIWRRYIYNLHICIYNHLFIYARGPCCETGEQALERISFQKSTVKGGNMAQVYIWYAYLCVYSFIYIRARALLRDWRAGARANFVPKE